MMGCRACAVLVCCFCDVVSCPEVSGAQAERNWPGRLRLLVRWQMCRRSGGVWVMLGVVRAGMDLEVEGGW